MRRFGGKEFAMKRDEIEGKLEITTFTAEHDPWTIPDSFLQFEVGVLPGEEAPSITIKRNNVVLQVIPADTKRNWRIIPGAAAGQYLFCDEISGAKLTLNTPPCFYFKWTGHNQPPLGVFALRLTKDAAGKFILVCTDDYRNGVATNRRDHKFAIQNTNSGYTNSIHVALINSGTAINPSYDFVILHSTGSPTADIPPCNGTNPNPACWS